MYYKSSIQHEVMPPHSPWGSPIVAPHSLILDLPQRSTLSGGSGPTRPIAEQPEQVRFYLSHGN